MADLFKEVDEEVRHDELKRLWKQWGPYLVGGVLTFLVVWSGMVFWRNYQRDLIEANSAAYGEALALVESDPEAALAAFSRLASEGSDGYGALAGLREAALRQSKGEDVAAVAIYDGLAADADVDPIIRDYAQLLAAMVVADTEGDDAMRARLDPLAAGDGAWANSAREMIAILDFRSGNLDAAESAFSQFSFAEGVPGPMRDRAREMLGLIDAARARAEAAAEMATPPVTEPETNESEEGSEEDAK